MSPTPPPLIGWLPPQERTRLILLAACAVVLIGVIEVARQARTWHWLAPPRQAPVGAVRPAPEAVGALPPELQVRDPVEVNRYLLADIEDGTGDRDPFSYYHLLDVARSVDRIALETRLAHRGITFAQLMKQPREWRGEPIALEGRLRRLSRFPAGKHPSSTFGFLYEAWIFTRDSQHFPYCVVVSEVPPDVAAGDSLNVPVRVAAYFMKLWQYKAGDGNRIAPLLLGRRIRKVPTPPLAAAPDIPAWIFGIYVVIGAVVALVLWRYAVRDRRFRTAVRPRLTSPGPEGVRVLAELEREARANASS